MLEEGSIAASCYWRGSLVFGKILWWFTVEFSRLMSCLPLELYPARFKPFLLKRSAYMNRTLALGDFLEVDSRWSPWDAGYDLPQRENDSRVSKKVGCDCFGRTDGDESNLINGYRSSLQPTLNHALVHKVLKYTHPDDRINFKWTSLHRELRGASNRENQLQDGIVVMHVDREFRGTLQETCNRTGV